MRSVKVLKIFLIEHDKEEQHLDFLHSTIDIDGIVLPADLQLRLRRDGYRYEIGEVLRFDSQEDFDEGFFPTTDTFDANKDLDL